MQRVSIFIVIVATIIGLILLVENIKYTLPRASLSKPYGQLRSYSTERILRPVS